MRRFKLLHTSILLNIISNNERNLCFFRPQWLTCTVRLFKTIDVTNNPNEWFRFVRSRLAVLHYNIKIAIFLAVCLSFFKFSLTRGFHLVKAGVFFFSVPYRINWVGGESLFSSLHCDWFIVRTLLTHVLFMESLSKKFLFVEEKKCCHIWIKGGSVSKIFNFFFFLNKFCCYTESNWSASVLYCKNGHVPDFLAPSQP